MHSEQAFRKAKTLIPGGVNSPVRAFKNVGGVPLFIARAYGAYIEDIEGRKYIDYVASYGPMINGHAHPFISEAVTKALKNGMSFGAPTEAETALAERVVSRVPNIDMIRMCNSGTEATMSAIRLARAVTGRGNILKFAGCYHGHSDGLLVAAGSGALTFGVPDSLGVPKDFAKHTLLAPYNDLKAVEAIFAEQGDGIAAIIVEPVAGNMNCVPPSKAFLQGLRDLATRYGAVLIFDEVMTGFRVAKAGAQELYGVKADLVAFGKIIGGGMPVGAFAGPKEMMSLLSPVGGVYQAGTLSGNPLAMAAGIANLELTESAEFYEALAQKTEMLVSGVEKAASKYNIPLVVNHVCGMIGFFFTRAEKVTNFDEAQSVDLEFFSRFFNLMLAEGIYLAPSPFETLFMSMAHTETDINNTIAAFETVFAKLGTR